MLSRLQAPLQAAGRRRRQILLTAVQRHLQALHITVAAAPQQQLLQLLQAAAAQSTDAHLRLGGWRPARCQLVRLVAHDQQRHALGHGIAQPLILPIPAGRQIKQQQHRIGGLQGRTAARDAQLLHPVIGGADAGGVQQGQGHPLQHQLALHQITGGAGQVGHDRPLAATEPVEQAALAHIGPTDDRHLKAIAQQLTALAIGQQLVQLCLHSHQGRGHGGAIQGGQVVLEIHPRLQLRQLIQQPLPQGCDALLQAAIQAGHGQLGRTAAAGRDQLTHRLGAGEIQAAVEKCPLAELPG